MYENLTDKQTLEAFARWYLKGKTIPAEPNGVGLQGKQHDFWNLYDYGGELKFVYVKCGFVTRPPREVTKGDRTPTAGEQSERFAQSISRAKSRIFELAICNEFTHFCTFTLDKMKRDRDDLAAFRKAFAQMVRNLNRARDEKIKYLVIPEPHEKGGWHMHGLLKGLTAADLTEFKLSDRIPERIKRTIRAGEKVYNWERYARSFGYFTATEIKNSAACSRYVTKYITKDMSKTVRGSGEHLYFASQGLNGRQVLAKHSFDAPPFDIEKVAKALPNGRVFENEYCRVITLTVADQEQLFGVENAGTKI